MLDRRLTLHRQHWHPKQEPVLILAASCLNQCLRKQCRLARVLGPLCRVKTQCSLASVIIWRVDQRIEDLSLGVKLPFT